MSLMQISELFQHRLDARFKPWVRAEIDGTELKLLIERPESEWVLGQQCGFTYELVTTGVEAFWVTLDGRFPISEFEYMAADKLRLVEELANLANLFFRGEVRVNEKRGLFGKRRVWFEIGDETVRFIAYEGRPNGGVSVRFEPKQ